MSRDGMRVALIPRYLPLSVVLGRWIVTPGIPGWGHVECSSTPLAQGDSCSVTTTLAATAEDEANGHILGGAYPSDGGRLSPALNLVYFRGEPPVFSVTGGAASENDGPLEFTVTLSESPSPQATVNYATSDGTAVLGSGGMGLFTVTLASTPSSEREVTVDWTTAPFEGQDAATTGADYTADSGTLTFAPGVRQQRICITIADDGEAEAAEKYRIEFSNASGAQLPDPASVVGTILDDDNPGVTVWPTALTVPEGSESDYTVRLTAPPETGVAVTLAMNAPADAEKLETSDGCCEPDRLQP